MKTNKVAFVLFIVLTTVCSILGGVLATFFSLANQDYILSSLTSPMRVMFNSFCVSFIPALIFILFGYAILFLFKTNRKQRNKALLIALIICTLCSLAGGIAFLIKAQHEAKGIKATVKQYPQFIMTESKGGGYYRVTNLSDTSSLLSWGKSGKTVGTIPINYICAEKIHEIDAGQEYIILQCSAGTGSWLNYILDMTSSYYEAHEDVLDVNLDNRIIVTEGNQDTAIVIRMIRSNLIQPVKLRGFPCQSSGNKVCIDAVESRNDSLFLRWTINDQTNDTLIMIDKSFFKKNARK